jgi:T-complex protein 1 subunit delta
MAPIASIRQTPKAYKDKDKPDQVRAANMQAAKAIADAVRTSLGPRGMDKMIQQGNGDVTITNDGATILNQMNVENPTAKMLVELSKAQDIEAGDGTTTVVIIAGSLLDAAQRLLQKGIHPTTISEAFQRAAQTAKETLTAMSTPVDMGDNQLLVNIASTSLNSKVVSQYAYLLAPLAVQAVMKCVDANSQNLDLKNIKIVKKLGGTVEDTEIVEGCLFDSKALGGPGAPIRVEKAKIGLIQFQLSAPKTDMENQVVVSDYTQMDRVLREERAYILERCKQIKKTGCNVLLIQKSILRDAVSDLAIHFLAKMKIMAIKDVEREDIEFVCKSIGCRPVASVDHFVAESLGSADLVEQVDTGSGGKIVRVTGVQHPGRAISILLRGSNKLVLDEAERSLHDALCVIRCLVKNKALVCGGGAPEMEISYKLREMATSVPGVEAYCWRAFAEAMEIIPYTLAENAGISPIATVTDLRARHAQGEKTAGINVRKGRVTNIMEENVVQPLLVSTTAVIQAAECVRSILKIDDIVSAVRL